MTIFLTCAEWCTLADTILLERDYVIANGATPLRFHVSSCRYLLEIFGAGEISPAAMLLILCNHRRRDVLDKMSSESKCSLLLAAGSCPTSDFERLCSPANYWIWECLLGTNDTFQAEMFKIVEKQASRHARVVGSQTSSLYYRFILAPIVYRLGSSGGRFNERQTYFLASALRDSILSGDKYTETPFVIAMMTNVFPFVTLKRSATKGKEIKWNRSVVRWIIDWIEKRNLVLVWSTDEHALALSSTMFRLSREMRRARVSPLALITSKRARLSRHRIVMLLALIIESFGCSFPTAEYQRHHDWYRLVSALITACVSRPQKESDLSLPRNFDLASISPRFGVIIDDCMRRMFAPVHVLPPQITSFRERVRNSDSPEEVSALEGYDFSD